VSVVEDVVEESSRPADRARTLRGLRAVLVLVAIADALVLLAAVSLAWQSRIAFDIWSDSIDRSADLSSTAGPWIVLAWLVILGAQGAYSIRQFGAGAEEFRLVFLASVITAGAVGMFCYLIQVPLSRGFVLLTFCYGTPMLLIERYAARKVVHSLRIRGRLVRRVIAVGGPAGVREVAAVLARERYVGYHVVGACVPSDVTVAPGMLGVPVLGSIGETREVCDRMGADTVLVARGGYTSSEELRQIAWDLEGGAIDLIVVPSLTDIAGPRISMRPVAGLPLLHVEQPQAGEAGGWSKRVFDIVTSAAILVLLSPLMLVVAVVVKLYDGGPVFFRQPRIGRDGEPFGMIKFRSMVVDAEARREELEHRNESDGPLFKIKDDPRITPFGRFIRRFSIDELPQLLNVVTGEMSLVGPRPPLPSEVEKYGADVHRRLKVRPGMTGLWQVSGRSELSWSESVRLDLYYVDNWSMMSDLVIITKTVRAVLRTSGAY
jgi:exopolysaccharide biosynthesis polyprenyl glycosylphosphotransferase